jgi:hypothetical protein
VDVGLIVGEGESVTRSMNFDPTTPELLLKLQVTLTISAYPASE